MTFIHDTSRVILPGNSTVPKLVVRFDSVNINSLMIQVSGGDAVVLGQSKNPDEGYNMQMGTQRIYGPQDFQGRSGTFELWMCAAGTSDVTVSLEYIRGVV